MIDLYLWTNDLDPFCMTIMIGAKREAVDTAFKIVPASRKLTTIADHWTFAGPDSEGNGVVQIDTLESGLIAFESNGWTGDDASVIRQIAAPLSVSIFRNINAVMRVTVAQKGQVVRQFDPLLYDADGALPEESAYNWNVEHPVASSFSLAETLTGIEITQAWLLDQPHATYKTLHGKR